MQKAKRATIEKFYKEHGSRLGEGIEPRVNEIRQAKALTTDPAVITAATILVQAQAAQLREVIAAIEKFDQQIEELFESHPDKEIFASLPGAGKALGPRLLAALGTDRQR